MNQTITESEISTARAVARKTSSKWKLVEQEDLEQSLILWLYENEKTVLRYKTDPEGPIKLLIALRRVAHQLAIKEQEERSATPLDYNSKYSIQQIERVLVAMFFLAKPTGAVRVHPSTGAMLDSGVEYVLEKSAMILDVEIAFNSVLEAKEKAILEMKFGKEYTYRDIALLTGISAPGSRKRLRKALRKIQSALNGN